MTYDENVISTAQQAILSDEMHLTDATNAERLAEHYGDVLRYDHRRGRWLMWNEHRWETNTGGVVEIAIESARKQYQDAVNIPSRDVREKVSRWAIGSESKQRLDAAISIAKNLPPIKEKGEGWDVNTLLLSCTNGVVDLSTGQLRNGRPDDRITMTTGIVYDPVAECPRWEHFLDEIFQGDRELIRYIQKALGYSISGDMREQVVFIGYGSGSNGKSVFFSTIRDALGDYGYDAPFSLFSKSNQPQSASNDLAALEFRRFTVSCEVLSNTKLNELRIKKLSGGDKETARYLYQEYFTFQPHCKIWLFVNHKPQVNDDSHGFWRRVRLIPFTRVFGEEEQDRQLVEKLRQELPGILAWLVRGCLLWQEEGLSPTPSCIIEATKIYQEENDELVPFINEQCALRDDVKTKVSDLWMAYQAWADTQGYSDKERLGSKTFSQKMKERFVHIRTETGRYFEGIYLANDTSLTLPRHKMTLQDQFHKTPLIATRVEGVYKNDTSSVMPGIEDREISDDL